MTNAAPIAAALILISTPAPAQGVADRLEAHVCTLGTEVGTVMLLTDASGREHALAPWPAAEVTRDGNRVMLTRGMDVLMVDGADSVLLADGAVRTGACVDVTDTTRLLIDQAFEAAMEADPNALTTRARQEADRIRAEGQAAIEAAEARARTAENAINAVRRHNNALSAQLAECREAMAEIIALPPDQRQDAREIVPPRCLD